MFSKQPDNKEIAPWWLNTVNPCVSQGVGGEKQSRKQEMFYANKESNTGTSNG
jgi:hypothetical protein